MTKKEPTPVTDITKIEADLKPLESEVTTLKERAEAMVIDSEEAYAAASDVLDVVNTKGKAVEKLRKFFVDPLNHQVKSINSMFKPQVEAAEEVVGIIKGKMKVWYDAQEAKRVAEQKILDDRRAAADAKREAQGKEAIAAPVREVAMPAKTVATGQSKVQVRKFWTHEILKISELPEEVTRAILEEAYRKGIIKTVVQKYVDAGTREMTGVRIYEDSRIATGNVRTF